MAAFLRGFVLVGCLVFQASSAIAAAKANDISPERELLITAPSVVNAPAAQFPGAWSFGGLIERLVGKDEASACVREWLESWTAPQKVGSETVGPRLAIAEKLIEPWQKRDGYTPDPQKKWEPKLANAPFRLLAIVNRIDLCAPAVAGSMKEVQDAWRRRGREKEFNTLMLELVDLGGGGGGYGFNSTSMRRLGNTMQVQISEANTAGEGRFVFGAIDDDGNPLAGGFTVIFEFVLTGSGTKDVREWAHRWHALGQWEVTSPEYVTRLEELTRGFTHARDARLGQLRTSEASFGRDREFRQFTFSSTRFSPALLTQTPAFAFSTPGSPEQRALAEFLHARDALIRSGIHQLPSSLPTRRAPVSVLAASAILPGGAPAYHWDPGSQVSRDARRIFSVNTCTGCHGGETACADGLHIRPRAADAEAVLSTFLNRERTPLRVSDPDVKGMKVQYKEMGDRAAILSALLEPSDRQTIRALHPILRERLSRTH